MSDGNTPQVLTDGEQAELVAEGVAEGDSPEVAQQTVAAGEQMLEMIVDAEVTSGESPEQAVKDVREEIGLDAG